MQQILLQLQSKCDALQQEIVTTVPRLSLGDGKFFVRSGRKYFNYSLPLCGWSVNLGNTHVWIRFGSELSSIGISTLTDGQGWVCFFAPWVVRHLGKFALVALLNSLRVLDRPEVDEPSRAALHQFLDAAAHLL